MTKIPILVFGNKDALAPSSCSCGSGSCHDHKEDKETVNCKNCLNHQCSKQNNSSILPTIYDIYTEIAAYLNSSKFGKFIDISFIDIASDDISSFSEISDLLRKGFEPPITVIDGIVRYHGGIMASLIYNDIKELLEEYYHVDNPAK